MKLNFRKGEVTLRAKPTPTRKGLLICFSLRQKGKWGLYWFAYLYCEKSWKAFYYPR